MLLTRLSLTLDRAAVRTQLCGLLAHHERLGGEDAGAMGPLTLTQTLALTLTLALALTLPYPYP